MWAVLRNKGSYAEITKIFAPHELPFTEDENKEDDEFCKGRCANCEHYDSCYD